MVVISCRLEPNKVWSVEIVVASPGRNEINTGKPESPPLAMCSLNPGANPYKFCSLIVDFHCFVFRNTVIADSTKVVTISLAADDQTTKHIRVIIMLSTQIGKCLSGSTEQNRIQHITVAVIYLAGKEPAEMFFQSRYHLILFELMIEPILNSSVRLKTSLHTYCAIPNKCLRNPYRKKRLKTGVALQINEVPLL